jgi:hypothetical protein
MQVNAFIFQGAPESFDHNIVHPASFVIHGNANVGILSEGGNKFLTGELAVIKWLWEMEQFLLFWR